MRVRCTLHRSRYALSHVSLLTMGIFITGTAAMLVGDVLHERGLSAHALVRAGALYPPFVTRRSPGGAHRPALGGVAPW
jgi:hypothetical protein